MLTAPVIFRKPHTDTVLVLKRLLRKVQMSKMVAVTYSVSEYLLMLLIKTGMTGAAQTHELAHLFSLGYAYGPVTSNPLIDFLNSQFAQIVTLIGVLVTLFVAVLTWLGNRPEKIQSPLDPKITVNKIERTLVDDDTWKELTIIELRRQVKIVGFSCLILVLLSIFHEFLDFVIIVLIGILMIFIISRTIVNFISRPYAYRCRDPLSAKFYVFKDALIIIEAEPEYIFSKAQDAIIGKHIKYIEANAEEQTIHAFHDGDTITTQGTISVKIQSNKTQLEQHMDKYSTIVIDFTPMPYNSMTLFTRIIPISYRLQKAFASAFSFIKEKKLIVLMTRSPKTDAKCIEEQSKIINHFLNKFLTTTTAK